MQGQKHAPTAAQHHGTVLRACAVMYMMSATRVGCAKARLSMDPVSRWPLRPTRLAAMYEHCSIHRITCAYTTLGLAQGT